MAQRARPAPPDPRVGEALPPDAFGLALRSAIQARGLSLERLQARLREQGIGVSLASLSNWQRSQCRPERPGSLRALRALEAILGLTPESLVVLLGPPRPRGRWVHHIPGAVPLRDVCPVPGNVERLLRDIQHSRDGELDWVSCQEEFRVGADRDERAVRTRAVFEARDDGVDRHVAVHYCERGVLPDIRRVAYCRMGRVRTDPEVGVTAVELLFERPLARGETYLVEYEFGYSASGPESTFYYRWFRVPAHEYVLQVQFDPAALPVRCFGLRKPNVSASADRHELRMSAWHTVHRADRDVRPGVHGISWEWD